MDVTFNCGSCGQHIVVDEAGAGITVQCPKCGQSLTVPQAATESRLETPVPGRAIRRFNGFQWRRIFRIAVVVLVLAAAVVALTHWRSWRKPTTQELAAFEADRKVMVMVGGQLVSRSDFVYVSGAIARKRRDGTVITVEHVGQQRTVSQTPARPGSMTPGPTHTSTTIVNLGSEEVLVKNYFPSENNGSYAAIKAISVDPVDGMKAFDTGTEPTFDQWRALKQR